MIICTDISIVVEDIMHGLQVEALFNLSERAHSQVYSGNSKSYTVHGGAFWNEISKTFISFISKKNQIPALPSFYICSETAIPR